jgi:2-polyprenyl-6-methoxyphenol hydroxylase-like FAD-dependent oxidoreductase
VHVIEGERVSDLTRDKTGRITGVTALGAQGEQRIHHARLTIGADGLRSVVARRARLARRMRWPERVAFVTHYRGVTGVGSRGEMLVTPDGYMGIAAVGAGGAQFNVSLVLSHSAVARYRTAGVDDNASTMANWIQSHPHIAPRFAQAERLTPVQSTGPFAARARRAWRPGLALVGDAADFFDPFTGEGMYSAMLGGESLAQFAARFLRDGRSHALHEYDRWRRSEFSAKWRVEWIIAGVVAQPWLMERAARAFALRPDMAHQLVGVTGDFVPAREVLRPSYISHLLRAAFSRASLPVANATHA